MADGLGTSRMGYDFVLTGLILTAGNSISTAGSHTITLCNITIKLP